MDINNLPKEGVDFNFIEVDDQSIQDASHNPIIEIARGLYEGVTVQFGQIQLLIEEDPPRMAFDFRVLSPGLFEKDYLDKNADFKNYLGDIISATIIGYNESLGSALNEDRNNNPKTTH